MRRNVHALAEDGPELEALARGIAVMMQRPQSDPTSWLGQAAIHQNGRHGSVHFLSWHRMYLYWFERILRQASGDDSLALPYWDYSVPSQRILPAPFRDPSNVLYVSERNPNVNAGEPPTSTSIFSTANAFAQTVFMHTGTGSSFGGSTGGGGAVESTPHNGVHTWVGGDGGFMGRVLDAPKDPLFWLHHANIDRLWEEWLRLGGGRANTSNPIFLTTPFTFFDEHGAQVTMTGSQILDTANQLGYRYDDQSASASGAISTQSRRSARRPLAPARRSATAVVAATKPSRSLTLNRMSATVPVALAKGGAATIAAAHKSAASRLTLTFNGVAGAGVRGVLYEVFVNANGGEGRRAHVGSLGLFGLHPDERHGHEHSAGNVSFDITNAVAGGAKRISRISVTLVPVNLSGSGSLPGGVLATIERVVISAQGPAATSQRSKQPKQPKQQTRAQRRKARLAQKAKRQKHRARQAKQRAKPSPQPRPVNRKRKRAAVAPPAHVAHGAGQNGAAAVPGNKSSAGDLFGSVATDDPPASDHAHH